MGAHAATGAAFLALAIWAYLILGRGRFWDLTVPAAVKGPRSTARVVVVIPARDEAAGIGETIRSLLAQDHSGPLSIILVDDQSSDGTAEIARAAAGAAPDRLTILSGAPLAPGWTGKLWAVAQGVDRALTLAPDFILLTDADIAHAPDNVATLATRAEVGDLDLVSLMVQLHCRSWAERALIPAFVFFFFMLYPPRWAADPTRRLAAAAGGCILIRPAALARIGGIAAIRGALIDDCTLADKVKSSGGRIRLDVTETTRSNRVYEGPGEIWRMIARTAFTQLRYSPLLLAGTILGLIATYLVPPLVALTADAPARWLGLVGWIAMASAYRPTVRFYRLHPLWSLALPLVACFYLAATLGSAVNYWRGRGGQWKGRAQALRPDAG